MILDHLQKIANVLDDGLRLVMAADALLLHRLHELLYLLRIYNLAQYLCIRLLLVRERLPQLIVKLRSGLICHL